MDVKRFLELTATDAWLTALEIAALLAAGGYWRSARGDHQVSGPRLDHVRHQLAHLRDPDGEPRFASVAMLASDGSTVLVYKQSDRITPRPSPY